MNTTILIIITIVCLIDIFGTIYIYQVEYNIPKIIVIPFIIFTILSFITIGTPFLNIHILDIYHPVYSDPEGPSTLSFIIAILGGLTLNCPITIGYIIITELQVYLRNKEARKRRF